VIATVDSLIAALQAAKERGLPGETAVTVYQDGWYHELAETIEDPSQRQDIDMWVVLTPTGPADSRFTPGGMPPCAHPFATRDQVHCDDCGEEVLAP
jgi:hypothetical protein